jgi:hypothetical protein
MATPLFPLGLGITTSGCQLKKKKKKTNTDCLLLAFWFSFFFSLLISNRQPSPPSHSFRFLHTHKSHLPLFLCRTCHSFSRYLSRSLFSHSRSLNLSRAYLVSALDLFFCNVFRFDIFKTRFVCIRKSNPSTHHSTGILGLPALSRR